MLTREQFRQIHHLIRPLKNRIENTIARGVVQLVDNAKKLQIIQLGVQEGEDIDDVEHLQPYGFKSVPHIGAETVVVFPGSDRGHPVAVVTDDRRSRPTGWGEGDAGVYNSSGATIRLMGANIEINPGPGGVIYVREDGGPAEALVRKSEHDAHVHPTGVGPSGPPTVPAVGSPVLRG